LKFSTKSKAASGIPTASLPDIVFMLLIFFMVSTVLKTSSGLDLVLPDAQKIEKLPGKRSVAVIWADEQGRISIDDHILSIADIHNIIYQKAVDPLNPMKLVSLKVDRNVEMKEVYAIQEQLRIVDGAALNVNYSSKTAID
jgi:biopolymer transport protein ExbD